MKQATARACSNIAFIKYWGNSDEPLKLPVNSSISMNLDGIYTETQVRWDDTLTSDELVLNTEPTTGQALTRVSEHLTFIRNRLAITSFAHVESANNFPMGAGIASSASSFAALTLAAIKATGGDLSEAELTSIARLGSGSASRSIPSGFVLWHMGDSHETSYAESFATPDYWDLVDVIAIISGEHKAVGSRQGHTSANTSDLQIARVNGAGERLKICQQAILSRDFGTFADVVEYDSNLMHAVMMTSRPPLFYWLPTTLTVMDAVRHWRANGVNVCYTLDAGPNVHCICLRADAELVADGLRQINGVLAVRTASVGGSAHLI
ncbi:MAG: diphosphomevalonate decarboxylase [Phototrophicales bacterium]|nr:diphosphomevalonate decarboxylase [Phototrophicales bacterium]